MASALKKVLKFALAGFVLLIVIGVVAGASSHHKPKTPTKVASVAPPPPTQPKPQPKPPAPAKAKGNACVCTADGCHDSNFVVCDGTAPTAPSPAPAPAPAPAAPASTPTAGEQNAVEAAQGYLSDGEGFSYQGLLNQLTSSYGNGFSQADATYAVNSVSSEATWDQQAVEAAQGYLSDGEGFSRAGLLNQLTSPYGNQFTLAQATYAVNKTYH
jgi:Host cell surface-exposed lipoprotein